MADIIRLKANRRALLWHYLRGEGLVFLMWPIMIVFVAKPVLGADDWLTRSTNVFIVLATLYSVWREVRRFFRTVLFVSAGSMFWIGEFGNESGGLGHDEVVHVRVVTDGEVTVLEVNSTGQPEHLRMPIRLEGRPAVDVQSSVRRVLSLGGASDRASGN